MTSWTEVTVEHDLDAHLSLRPQTWMEERHIEAGRTIDLQTGDEAFDERFVVEGAPSERVLRALDSEMIQDLMEHPLLVGVETPEAGTLTLSFRHWLSAAHVEDAMILAWNLTQALSGELESSPYRSPAKPPTDDAGRSELEAVARARSERAVHQKEAGRVFLVVGLCVGACVLLAAWAYISS
ncbi:MAG: hypothetical protein KC619_25805 [Myxococcales bacterium]|nr:hypothetical protein [Myxococcales bacterium]